MSSSIRIAISGGGLGSVALLRALIKFSHLDVHVFDPVVTSGKPGNAVGLAHNGMEALHLLSPSIEECFKRAGSIPMKEVISRLGSGPNQGSELADNHPKNPEKGVTNLVQSGDFIESF